jgi:cellulose biosynthesis protein BcsQ
MIRERYAIWNNKGGVGKSTLTFHIGSLYADMHPDEKVLIIDMCPQANSTMMLLGSGTKGEDLLIKMENQTPAPTIAGYIASRIIKQADNRQDTPPISHWVSHPCDHNPSIPANLFLIAGDGNLELLAAPVAYYSNAQFPENAWGSVHVWIRELADEVTKDEVAWTIFIDTNPSFAIYTELAMIAADKLIVPFNADDSSRHAVSAIARLLYGAGTANPVYDRFTFRHRTAENRLAAPKLHLFIGNRFTQYGGPATAFAALHQAVGDSLWGIYQKNSDVFTDSDNACETKGAFLGKYSADIRDFNTAGVVAAHCGTLLKKLKDGSYPVHSETVEVRKEQIDKCIDSMNTVIGRV